MKAVITIANGLTIEGKNVRVKNVSKGLLVEMKSDRKISSDFFQEFSFDTLHVSRNLFTNAPYGHPFLPHFPDKPSCVSWDHFPSKHLHVSPCLRVCFWENPN